MNHRQRGVALLMVLLILALMMVLASAMTERSARMYQQTTTTLDNLQAKWYALGAETLATALLQRDALDSPIIRPNIAVFGQQTWTKLRRHKLIVQAIKGTAQGAGMVSRQEFAEFFELQEVLVGAGFVNQAKKGQAATMSRVWGKHAAFLYRDRAAGPQAGVTYGFTAAWGNKIAGSIDEPKIGLTGSQRVRSGERVKEVICARDLGYFFQNAVA